MRRSSSAGQSAKTMAASSPGAPRRPGGAWVTPARSSRGERAMRNPRSRPCGGRESPWPSRPPSLGKTLKKLSKGKRRSRAVRTKWRRADRQQSIRADFVPVGRQCAVHRAALRAVPGETGDRRPAVAGILRQPRGRPGTGCSVLTKRAMAARSRRAHRQRRNGFGARRQLGARTTEPRGSTAGGG